MKHQQYLHICLVMLFINCSNKKTPHKIDEKIEYQIDVLKDSLNAISTLYLSDIIDNYNIIRLETNNNCLIGSVNKIYMHDSRIYILDNTISQSLFVFDVDGRFLFNINNKGNGPFEYLEINDFTFDKSTNELVLLDAQKKKIIYYDNTGKPLREQNLPFFADYFEILDSDHYVFLGSATEDRVILWNISEKKAYKTYYKYDIKQSVKTIKPLDKFNNSIFHTRNLNDTIIEIKQDGLSASRVINYGKYKVKESQLKEGFLGTLNAICDCMTNTRLYNESNDFIYFVFDYEMLNKESPYYALYSKKTNNILFYTNETLIDDITFSPYAPQFKTVNDDGQFIFPISSIDIINSIKRLKEGIIKFKKDRFENFIELTKGIKETDNPIIALYKFKTLSLPAPPNKHYSTPPDFQQK